MNAQMSSLKQILLQRNIAVDNKYLDLYIKLIELNLNNAVGVKHHIIPVCTYPEQTILVFKHRPGARAAAQRRAKEKAANSDPANILVRLSKPDHHLAHAYLHMAGCKTTFSCDKDAMDVILRNTNSRGE